MADQLESLEALVSELQREVEMLKCCQSGESHNGASSFDRPESLDVKFKEMQNKLEKIEGNLGVDKIVLADVGDKVLVTVQTPLGTVPVTLPHTPNTSAKSGARGGTLEPSQISGSAVAVAPTFAGTIKGGPPAGMTTEQLQDFKKQTLQINQLQQKIKDLEYRIQEANVFIKKGEDVTTDLTTKVSEDVKEIYVYLDDINTTMSQKIASQRVEMEKLAGDTPAPINYDPFNYGEAYAGDVVDFEARKRIVEMDLLFQSLQMAMNQMKDSVRASPDINLGYKVVRLDHLIESTGFGPAIRNGELTTDNGLLINQASKIEPPERRYPIKESFQTDEEKEYQWSITDSIMQTMYRLEVELAALQNRQEGTCHVRDAEEGRPSLQKNSKAMEMFDESFIKNVVERECKWYLGELSTAHLFADPGPSTQDRNAEILKSNVLEKLLLTMRDQMKQLEGQIEYLYKHRSKGSHTREHHDQPTPFNPFTCKNIHSFYKQPVKLRYLLQRVYRHKTGMDRPHIYVMPRPLGVGYDRKWPKSSQKVSFHEREKLDLRNPIREIKDADNIASIVQPQTQEYFIKGKDGRWYRGDQARKKSIIEKH